MSDLEAILLDLRFGRFELTDHAELRMEERGIDREDIRSVGYTCFKSRSQANGSWLIFGKDKSGDTIRVVCVYDGDTIIITVMG